MRNMTKACAFLVVVCVAAFGQQQSPMQETLTNFKIIRMVQSNMSPDLIIQTISKCSPRFALDPISIENMKQNGVTEDIVKAITAKQNGQPIPGIERPLDSTGVIRMWQAGVSKSTILQEIARRTPEYHFDTASLQTFEIANVPEDIIKAMAARENGTNQPEATEPPADQPQQTTAKLNVQPIPGNTLAKRPADSGQHASTCATNSASGNHNAVGIGSKSETTIRFQTGNYYDPDRWGGASLTRTRYRLHIRQR